jgi:hypothetical protein
MDYLKGYKVFRDDPEWGKKTLTGTLLFLSTMFLPVLGQAVLVGWQALILRRAVRGEDSPLPRLDFDTQYLGKLLALGFKGFIVRFVWSLPVMVIGGGLFVCAYLGIVVAAVGGAQELGEDAAGISMVCCCSASFLILMPILVLLSLPANVAAMRTELTDDLNRGLEFGEVMRFTKAMFGPLFKGSLVLWLVGSLLSFVGLLACYVGAFAVAVAGMAAQAHFVAQVYRAWVEQGGEALPVAASDV